MVPGRRGTLRAVAVQLPRHVYLAIGRVLSHPRFHPAHRRLYRMSGGRGPVSRALGVDMILVATRGRRSGAQRVVPLAAVRDGSDWVVVGTNAGKPRLPAWVLNLRADPRVAVEHRTTIAPHVAHEVDGADYERLWRLVTGAYPGFIVYRDRTPRPVPLFVLRPASASPPPPTAAPRPSPEHGSTSDHAAAS
jgi:F420H(2)-dependent quinone reductase